MLHRFVRNNSGDDDYILRLSWVKCFNLPNGWLAFRSSHWQKRWETHLKKKTLLVVQEEKIWNFNQSVWEAKRKRSKQKWKLKNLTSQVRQIDNVTSNLRTLQLMSKLRIPPRRCLRVVSAPPLQQSSSSACPTKSLKHCDLHFPAALPPDLKQREVGRVGQHGHSKGFWHKPSQPNVFYIDCTKCKVFMAAAANKWLRSTKAYFSSSMSSRNLILAEWSKSWCHSSLLSF